MGQEVTSGVSTDASLRAVKDKLDGSDEKLTVEEMNTAWAMAMFVPDHRRPDGWVAPASDAAARTLRSPAGSFDPEAALVRVEPGKVITGDDLAGLGLDRWQHFRKVPLTAAVRVEGPFRVATSESETEPFYCDDGYLAVDARGYPYAIAVEEFELIYAPARSSDEGGPGIEGKPLTTVGRLSDLLEDLEGLRQEFGRGDAGRELSLAITEIETGLMRLNRAWAKRGGFFTVADTERIFWDRKIT